MGAVFYEQFTGGHWTKDESILHIYDKIDTSIRSIHACLGAPYANLGEGALDQTYFSECQASVVLFNSGTPSEINVNCRGFSPRETRNQTALYALDFWIADRFNSILDKTTQVTRTGWSPLEAALRALFDFQGQRGAKYLTLMSHAQIVSIEELLLASRTGKYLLTLLNGEYLSKPGTQIEVIPTKWGGKVARFAEGGDSIIGVGLSTLQAVSHLFTRRDNSYQLESSSRLVMSKLFADISMADIEIIFHNASDFFNFQIHRVPSLDDLTKGGAPISIVSISAD